MLVDGMFFMGVVISVFLLVLGINLWISIFVVVFGGVVVGVIIGFLYVKFKIDNLMVGIFMMIGLYLINLRIMGKVNVFLFNVKYLFKL